MRWRLVSAAGINSPALILPAATRFKTASGRFFYTCLRPAFIFFEKTLGLYNPGHYIILYIGKDATVINEKLLSDCKAKVRSAQRQLYEYMAPKLHQTCRRYLKQQADIEEILADAFYAIFTKLDQLKDTGAFEAWARRITVNFCLLRLRKSGTLDVYLDDMKQEPQHYTLPSQLEERDLLKLLDHLPEGCRTIFNLFAIEGYSHKEIALMLQISEGTSKSQLSFSKTKLKSLINQFYYLNEN